MSRSQNWPGYASDGQRITATAVSDRFPIGGDPYLDDVLIYNPGPNVVRIKLGDASVVATDLSVPVLAGSAAPFSRGLKGFIAVISPSGNQVIEVHSGEGA